MVYVQWVQFLVSLLLPVLKDGPKNGLYNCCRANGQHVPYRCRMSVYVYNGCTNAIHSPVCLVVFSVLLCEAINNTESFFILCFPLILLLYLPRICASRGFIWKRPFLPLFFSYQK
ncbi:hypothetical protein BDB00DRAFT_565223 [Zychaea mexicana]|uniref:uncharacterized protein n=1 Tax=Zychaea mexicana TaxID=64656 RepID=UPI0022FE2E07|nr:uncharacterized protein BDB00DRAFT_565223 [Zychaea mexicana]KAI9490132.1 hypothetical protein BDB00DRAFT_565223 [Zychaea mexicana]